MKEINRPLRVGRCLEDSPLVLLQDLEPVVEIGGVVVARLRRDAKVAAQERGPDLRYQFLAGIPLVAELRSPKIPVKA